MSWSGPRWLLAVRLEPGPPAAGPPSGGQRDHRQLIESRVLESVRQHPGQTTTQVKAETVGRDSQIAAALGQLSDAGLITEERRGSAHVYWPVAPLVTEDPSLTKDPETA